MLESKRFGLLDWLTACASVDLVSGGMVWVVLIVGVFLRTGGVGGERREAINAECYSNED